MTIKTLLVANRGEIARRIFRTAKSMGIVCIAVYTDTDSNEPFVKEAEKAIRLSTNYLDKKEIIDAARRTGSDAIHPGYGFLSENASFAKAVTEEGIIWVGPSSEAIESMGDKITAKKIAQEANVPTLPSSDDLDDSSSIGFPLLVKAAAGGGGKGMRIVANENDLPEAISAAQREAKNAFDDERVFLERYIPKSRHIEVQILGDSHGNLLHLGERECSIQRRHQKIIEEAPSSAISEEQRELITDAALRIGESLDYQSAGTVEFLLDDETGDFFFLEVNTRLQVEHPVTEAITGIDLVREQLKISSGEAISFIQDNLISKGHAVEARLYAEDPSEEFLPSTGEILAFSPPEEPDVRWDSGIEKGSFVGVEFDPMLAKVISLGTDRTEATLNLAKALEKLHLAGVTTNRNFLVSTLRHNKFLKGETTTDFIEDNSPQLHLKLTEGEIEKAAIVAALWMQNKNRKNAIVLKSIPSGWRNGRLPAQEVSLLHSGEKITVSYKTKRNGSFVFNNGSTATIYHWSTEHIETEIDGERMASLITEGQENIHIQTNQGTVSFEILPRFEPPALQIAEGSLVAPMPGVVLEIKVSSGDAVSAGDTLLTLEAMKMEHHVKAPYKGTVAEILVSENQQLDNGVPLLVINPVDENEKGNND
ncbi:MAG: biotin carboxylase N-terminal domain-containing protein [Acidimicrobiales bacterium]|nr:biotin carboxylase N-terminal domain-containing protein [Acidimicrobiales bacterium]